MGSRSGQVRKVSPPPGFDPRTSQPVASHYTIATRLTLCVMPFTYYEVWENQYSKAYPSLPGINECLSVVSTFGIRYQTLNICEFCKKGRREGRRFSGECVALCSAHNLQACS